MSLYLVSIILGIIEGLTEFVPISSTGHLIVGAQALNFNQLLGSADKAELFLVVIQLGAVLAIGFLYRARLTESLIARSADSRDGRLRMHLLVAFLPAAIVGFLFHTIIKTYLFSPLTVAISLIVGGIVILRVEKVTHDENRTTVLDSMTTKQALVVGLAQVLSLIPGTSRSAATIIGGMLTGIKRASATEFSFLLSFPVMIAASGYELFKYRELLSQDMLGILVLGFVTAFIVALLVVKWLIRFVQNHRFTGFGAYRIIFGIIVLVLYGVHYFS